MQHPRVKPLLRFTAGDLVKSPRGYVFRVLLVYRNKATKKYGYLMRHRDSPFILSHRCSVVDRSWQRYGWLETKR